ncbi:MAG TPA: hypothetical protein VKY90_17330 [Candidatus Dormibacteraeota bacterium]|nr:hypothetical protein [Candidatus Dormibacteraeota bacterium]
MSEPRDSTPASVVWSNDHRSPSASGDHPPDPYLSIVIDQACTRIWEVWGEEDTIVGLRVNPAVYRAVARARPGEVVRGYPLMLLGLELVPDETVATYEPAVIRG